MHEELLNYYKNYLLGYRKSGKATVKNYVADVRKFIAWYEQRYNLTFTPKSVTKAVAQEYLNLHQGTNTPTAPSASSVKRYASSLRKFFEYLKLQQMANINPFEVNQPQYAHLSDPWHLKEFRNFLFLSNISKVTRKNYTLDIQQFTQWAEKVITASQMPVDASVLKRVDSTMVNEYKNRLLTEANLSPVSINRKLSSLRKYFSWAAEKQFLQTPITVSSEMVDSQPLIPAQIISPEPVKTALSLEDLRTIELENQLLDAQQPEKNNTYSSFAPFRLAQKTARGLSIATNALFLAPFDKTVELARYSYWKLSGRKVFASIEEVVGTAAPIVANEAVKQLQVNNAGALTLKTAKILSLVGQRIGLERPGIKVKSFPKSFYAPLSISTSNLPLKKRMWHHMRHTRPAWYHKYHSYQFVHYLHFGILLAATSIIGMHVYTTLAHGNDSAKMLSSAPATAPPRTLYFQGKLNDNTNTPITAETDLRFAIYKSPTGTGSAQLWRESQTVKPDQDGTFRVLLGKRTTLSQDIFTDYPNLYLGISVGKNKELLPRQPLANVTNASNANTLQGLKPITEINAGTRNVILALDSSGNLTIGGSANPTFQATGGEFTLSGQILTLTTNTGSNANVQIKPDGLGIIDMQKPIQNTTNYSTIPSIAGAVEIDDIMAVIADSNGQSAFTVNQNSTGPIISASASGVAKFTLDHQGNGFFAGNIALGGNSLSSSSNTFNLLGTPINIAFGENASSLSLGASTGTTTVNNNLRVKGITTLEGAVTTKGLLTLNEGLTIPAGKKITLGDYKPGSVLFMNDKSELASDSANFFWDAANKRLGIGTNTPGAPLSVGNMGTGTGTALVIDANGNVFKSSSSQRYKDDIKPLATNSLVLLNASPVSFRYKNTGTYDIGYMAEDLDMLGLKDLVIYDKEGKPDAIRYDKLSIYILEIVKQQQAAIKALEETAATIKAGYIESQQIISNTITNISEDITIGGQTLKDYIVSIVSGTTTNQQPAVIASPVASDSASINQDSEFIASTSGQVAGAQLQLASPAATLLTNSNEQYTNSATSSALTEAAPIASSSATASTSASAQPAPTPTSVQPPSPLLQPGNIVNIKFEGPQTNYADIASFSAELAFVPNLKSDYATFNQGLIALGPTSLTDVGVSGKLSVGGNLQISDNAIDTIGSDLNLQSLRQGNLSIMGGLIRVDTDGNLFAGGNANFAQNVNIAGRLAAGVIAPVPGSDVVVKLDSGNATSTDVQARQSTLAVQDQTGKTVASINQKGDVIASGSGTFANITIVRGVQADTSLTETNADGSAGKGVITAYETERTIRTPYVTAKSLIYVTATSNTQQVTPYIARQTANSFTVQIPSAVTKDITFNWWIVN